MMDLGAFNAMNDADATAELMALCHSRNWAAAVSRARPFSSVGQLARCCESAWQEAGEADILEAFAGHPRIGDLDALRGKYGAAGREQGQVAQAPEAVLKELWLRNREYEARHGFIFVVCASGKTAEEMLSLLLARLPNSRAAELATGAREQAKITALRLRARFGGHAAGDASDEGGEPPSARQASP